MILPFAWLIAIGIACYIVSSFIDIDGIFYKSTLSFLGGALVGIAVIKIIASYEPTVIDYMRGRVDVNIQETYVDSVLVKRDTIITYKK